MCTVSLKKISMALVIQRNDKFLNLNKSFGVILKWRFQQNHSLPWENISCCLFWLYFLPFPRVKRTYPCNFPCVCTALLFHLFILCLVCSLDACTSNWPNPKAYIFICLQDIFFFPAAAHKLFVSVLDRGTAVYNVPSPSRSAGLTVWISLSSRCWGKKKKTLLCMCSKAASSSNDGIDWFVFFFLKGKNSDCVSEHRRSDHIWNIFSALPSLTMQSPISEEDLSIHNSAEIRFLDKVLTPRA